MGSVLPPPLPAQMAQEVKSAEKYRNWVFTLNNHTDDDIERLANPYEQVKYIAYGKEIAPTTETPHLQGYICCWEPQRMTFFKRQIPRAHMEPMRGRLQDNDMYIEKEGDLTTWGQKPDQGRRSDIVGLKRNSREKWRKWISLTGSPCWPSASANHRQTG